MKFLVAITLVLICPRLVLAGLKWHEFGTTNEGGSFVANKISVTVDTNTEQDRNEGFWCDHLVLTVKMPGEKPLEKWFDSTYGYGAVAIQDHLLFLRYGVGRGTCAREEHVQILRLEGLEELADVKTSYYVANDSAPDPDLVAYKMKVKTGKGYTNVIFRLPTPIPNLPREKIVRIKNESL